LKRIRWLWLLLFLLLLTSWCYFTDTPIPDPRLGNLG